MRRLFRCKFARDARLPRATLPQLIRGRGRRPAGAAPAAPLAKI